MLLILLRYLDRHCSFLIDIWLQQEPTPGLFRGTVQPIVSQLFSALRNSSSEDLIRYLSSGDNFR